MSGSTKLNTPLPSLPSTGVGKRIERAGAKGTQCASNHHHNTSSTRNILQIKRSCLEEKKREIVSDWYETTRYQGKNKMKKREHLEKVSSI